jgi:hypothetical protein
MRHDAIFNTHPNAVSIDGDNIAYDRNGEIIELNEAAVLAEQLRLVKEYEDTKYQRDRARKYPPLQDLADAIYHQQNGDDSKMTEYLAAVEAVKQKYPKGVA